MSGEVVLPLQAQVDELAMRFAATRVKIGYYDGHLAGVADRVLQECLGVPLIGQIYKRVDISIDPSGEYGFQRMKPAGQLGLLQQGLIDVAIVGSDTWEEADEYERSGLTVETRFPDIDRWPLRAGARRPITRLDDARVLATSYPRTVGQFLSERQRVLPIVTYPGSVESLAYRPGYAVADIVASGASKVANGIRDLDDCPDPIQTFVPIIVTRSEGVCVYDMAPVGRVYTHI